MIRIHDALRSRGVDSHVHCADPIDSGITCGHSLEPATGGGADRSRRGQHARRSRRLAWWSRRPAEWSWEDRIAGASRENADFEAFSPPVASADWDFSGVMPAENPIDVLHLHWAGGLFDFETFFDQVNVPVVWTLHDQNPYLGGFHYQHDVDAATTMLPLEYEARDLKRRALANVSLTLAANSQWNHEAAAASSVLPDSAVIETVYLPIPVDSFQAMDKAAAKRSLEIDPERFVLGFVCASLSGRRKGFLDLVEAFERLPPAIRQRTTLLSFGHAPSKRQRALVSADWKHLGHLSDLGEQSCAYSAMDVFVIASTEEAFGQTPVEALLCGTVVIGTDVGGIPETVVDGQTGRVVPHRDPLALADRIQFFHDHPEKRQLMAQKGRNHVVKRHAIDVVAEDHLALYHAAIERHRK